MHSLNEHPHILTYPNTQKPHKFIKEKKNFTQMHILYLVTHINPLRHPWTHEDINMLK